MAASSFTPSLLDLPLELKLKIYQMLLCPDRHKVYTLYHDRHGRRDDFKIGKSIARQSHFFTIATYSKFISLQVSWRQKLGLNDGPVATLPAIRKNPPNYFGSL